MHKANHFLTSLKKISLYSSIILGMMASQGYTTEPTPVEEQSKGSYAPPLPPVDYKVDEKGNVTLQDQEDDAGQEDDDDHGLATKRWEQMLKEENTTPTQSTELPKVY